METDSLEHIFQLPAFLQFAQVELVKGSSLQMHKIEY